MAQVVAEILSINDFDAGHMCVQSGAGHPHKNCGQKRTTAAASGVQVLNWWCHA